MRKRCQSANLEDEESTTNENMTSQPSKTSGVLRLGSYRQRPLVFLLLGSVVVGSCLFLLHSSRSQLQAASQAFDKCQQSRDTLSAQLQVAFEQNNRMEATLKQEREVHRKVKEELEKKTTELQQQLDNEKQTLEAKYDQLSKDNQLLESQLNENQDKLKQAEEHYAAKMEEIKAQKEDEADHLGVQVKDLLSEKDQLEKEQNDLKKQIKNAMENLLLCQKNCPAQQNLSAAPEKSPEKSKVETTPTKKVLPQQQHSSPKPTPAARKLPPLLRPMGAPAVHLQESAMAPPPQAGQMLPPQDLRRSHQKNGPINSQNDRQREAEPDYNIVPEGGDDQEGERVDDSPRGDHGGNRHFHDDFDDQENLEEPRPQQHNGREGVVADPK